MDRLRYRIFFSSPQDVRPERLLGEAIVRKLAREFQHHCDLEAVFWEREPLQAGHHFQDFRNIPPPRTADICVVILWSRLGTLLPAEQFRGALSGQPVTGTEWEFEDALAGFREHGRPHLLLYRKTAAPMADLSDRQALQEQVRQADLVQAFLDRWIRSDDGLSFKAASHHFATAAEFEARLEEHLRTLLRRRLEADHGAGREGAAISWTGPPWRGLAAFDAEQAEVFFGRTRARNETRELLTRRAEAGIAFLLVLGASGSGKSSLVKAGLAPDVQLPGMIGRVGLVRTAALKPSNGGGDLAAALAAAVCAALPELEGLNHPPERLADQFRSDPDRFPLGVELALGEAARTALTTEGEARLLVIVDQLEELFTADNLAPADRAAFIRALKALATSGHVWVVATMRSDYFDRLETEPALCELAVGGQYLLVPPTLAELAEIVRRPADAAGLQFEYDDAAGEGLDDVIVRAAAPDPGALPLLSFLLDQLWQRRDPESGRLSFSAYRALGGFEGALAGRAEAVFQAMPEDVRAAFHEVLFALVTIAPDASKGPAARTAPLAHFGADTAARRLVTALMAPDARLLVADGEAGGGTVRVAHEALLSAWPRARADIEQYTEDLQRRARVEAAAGLWLSEGKPASRLLPAGRPLTEAEGLVAAFPTLESGVADYVAASGDRARQIEAEEAAARQSERLVDQVRAFQADARSKFFHRGNGRLVAMVVLVALLGLQIIAPGLFDAPRRAAFDAYQRLAPGAPATQQVAVVEIDDASISQIGQWPWPRQVIARLVASVLSADPAAVGLDMLFDQPDRSSPEQVLRQSEPLPPAARTALGALPSHDSVLGNVLASGPVAIGLAGQAGGDPPSASGPPTTVRVIGGGAPTAGLQNYGSALRSIPELDRAAPGHGDLSASADADNVVRRLPLVVGIAGRPAPSLDLEMLRLAAHRPLTDLNRTPQRVLGVAAGKLTLPTSADGTIGIDFRPPDGRHNVSAIDVLSGRFPAEAFRGRLVLVGLNATGESDSLQTPLGLMPGIEIHAQALENILDGRWVRRPGWAPALETGAALAVAALLIILLPRLSLIWQVLGVAVPLVAAWILSFLLWTQARILLDPLIPSLIVLLSILAGALSAFLAERNLRRAVAGQTRLRGA